MRRSLLALILLGGVIFMLGAGASSASAANCTTPGAYPIFYNGSNLQYTHTIFYTECNDVDLVEFHPQSPTGTQAGILNNTNGIFHPVNIPPTLSDVICGRYGVPLNLDCSFVGHVNLWGCGPVPQNLSSYSRWRIHRLSTQTWGSYVLSGSGGQSLNC
jgi:hypothetical protein